MQSVLWVALDFYWKCTKEWLKNSKLTVRNDIVLDMLGTYCLNMFDSNTTQYLSAISNFLYKLWMIYCTDFINFSTCGANKFRVIRYRWGRMRRELSNPEQTWLISQPSRNAWGTPVNLIKCLKCLKWQDTDLESTIKVMLSPWTSICRRSLKTN